MSEYYWIMELIQISILDTNTLLYGMLRDREIKVAWIYRNEYADLPIPASVLRIAAYNNSFHSVKLLLSRGTNINIDPDGGTVLGSALENPEAQIAEYVMDRGTNIHHTDGFSTSAVHLAIYHRYSPALSLPLHRGIAHHTKSSSFGTVLHCGARRSNIKIIRVRIKAKLQNIEISNKWEGRTALGNRGTASGYE